MNNILFQLKLDIDAVFKEKEFVFTPKYHGSANSFTDIEQKKIEKGIELLTDALGSSFMRTLESTYNEIQKNRR
jgi:hypothetical protein